MTKGPLRGERSTTRKGSSAKGHNRRALAFRRQQLPILNSWQNFQHIHHGDLITAARQLRKGTVVTLVDEVRVVAAQAKMVKMNPN